MTTKIHPSRYIDHTLLKADALQDDFSKLVQEANQYDFFSVCVPACYVPLCKQAANETVSVCTVIGFPLGYNVGKQLEAEIAVELGADELDMVINIGKLKSGKLEFVQTEIEEIKDICEDKVLKVIIETALLTDDEIKTACEIINNTQADFIKTSTGFSTRGASLDDIKLFKQYLDPSKKIKASGGIRSKEDFEQYLDLGCERIGTSSGVAILKSYAN